MEDDLLSVYREVLDLAINWMDVGLVLGLRHTDLKEISTTCRENPKKCLKEALAQWLKQKYDVDRNGLPTWKKLVEVAEDPIAGENPALATILARNHQGMQYVRTSMISCGIIVVLFMLGYDVFNVPVPYMGWEIKINMYAV